MRTMQNNAENFLYQRCWFKEFVLILGFDMACEIRHSGTVSAVNGNVVTVTFLQQSACAGCQAAKLCRISESKEKSVQVRTSDPQSYQAGQPVIVAGTTGQSWRAVILSFGVPLVLLMTVLVIVIAVTHNEGLAAGLSLVALVLYYMILFVCRDRIRRKFEFKLIQ